jgi:hypothetical protein
MKRGIRREKMRVRIFSAIVLPLVMKVRRMGNLKAAMRPIATPAKVPLSAPHQAGLERGMRQSGLKVSTMW